jgi:L-amino acid N-acyltransferase YncA
MGSILIITEGQLIMAKWLEAKIGYVGTPHLRCIGNYLNDKLMGVVAFDHFNGCSMMIHSAGEGNWLTKEMLYAVFHYPFEVCKVRMLIGLVPSANDQALRFNSHIGFKVDSILDGAHPDGALVIMTMQRGECRYLHRRSHGQKVEAATSA